MNTPIDFDVTTTSRRSILVGGVGVLPRRKSASRRPVAVDRHARHFPNEDSRSVRPDRRRRYPCRYRSKADSIDHGPGGRARYIDIASRQEEHLIFKRIRGKRPSHG